MKKEAVFDVFYLLFLMILFFLLATPYLNLPAPFSDEAFIVINAARIVKEGEPYGVLLDIFGKQIPIMTHEHVGIISSLLFIPSFYLFGINVYTMRLTRIFFGFMNILLLYYFAKLFFNRRIAIISSFLLATLPFNIFLYRHGFLDDGLNPILMLISLICFYKFKQNRKNYLLYLGSFVTGLGLSNKLNFLWYILSLSICFIVFRKKIKLKLNKKQIILAVLFFLIGSFPIILYNIHVSIFGSQYYVSTIQEIKTRLIYPKYAGNNLNIFYNILERINELKYILNNDYSTLVKFSNFLYFTLFLITFFIYFSLSIIKKNKVDNKTKFLISMLSLIFFFSLFVITVLRPEHYAIILPILFILFAKFLDDILNIKKLKIILYFGIALITIFNLLTLSSTYKVFKQIGTIPPQQYRGWHHSSDAAYNLSNYLLDNNIYTPITIGPGVGDEIWFLTDLKIHVPMCENEDNFEKCIQLDKQKHYLIKVQQVSYKFYNLFLDELKKHNKTAIVKKVFTRRDGTPEILVLEIKDGKIPSNLDQYFEEFK